MQDRYTTYEDINRDMAKVKTKEEAVFLLNEAIKIHEATGKYGKYWSLFEGLNMLIGAFDE